MVGLRARSDIRRPTRFREDEASRADTTQSDISPRQSIEVEDERHSPDPSIAYTDVVTVDPRRKYVRRKPSTKNAGSASASRDFSGKCEAFPSLNGPSEPQSGASTLGKPLEDKIYDEVIRRRDDDPSRRRYEFMRLPSCMQYALVVEVADKSGSLINSRYTLSRFHACHVLFGLAREECIRIIERHRSVASRDPTGPETMQAAAFDGYDPEDPSWDEFGAGYEFLKRHKITPNILESTHAILRGKQEARKAAEAAARIRAPNEANPSPQSNARSSTQPYVQTGAENLTGPGDNAQSPQTQMTSTTPTGSPPSTHQSRSTSPTLTARLPTPAHTPATSLSPDSRGWTDAYTTKNDTDSTGAHHPERFLTPSSTETDATRHGPMTAEGTEKQKSVEEILEEQNDLLRPMSAGGDVLVKEAQEMAQRVGIRSHRYNKSVERTRRASQASSATAPSVGTRTIRSDSLSSRRASLVSSANSPTMDMRVAMSPDPPLRRAS